MDLSLYERQLVELVEYLQINMYSFPFFEILLDLNSLR